MDILLINNLCFITDKIFLSPYLTILIKRKRVAI